MGHYSNQEKAVFLDRDGTINVDIGYTHTVRDFAFIDGAIDALRAINSLGYKLIIITNQSGIAKGIYSEIEYNILTDWLIKIMKSYNVPIAGIYYCPHHPCATISQYKKICTCRKPGTTLFYYAAKQHNIDFALSYAVGDRLRDLSICSETKCKGVLVGNSESTEIIEKIKRGDVRCVTYYANLQSFADFLSI